jgi:ferredoxin
MNFKVDQDLCIGCGLCAATCPEVFELENDLSQVKLTPVPQEFQDDALTAERICPVEAISHIN